VETVGGGFARADVKYWAKDADALGALTKAGSQQSDRRHRYVAAICLADAGQFMNTKVFAVVLTYNRPALLEECLMAVTTQTRPCDLLIIIDNASTDGTVARLLEKWSDRAKVHVLSRNIGAAGGFSAGLRIAYAEGADFIWVMDDDLIPSPDALEKLMAADATLRAVEKSYAYLVSCPRTPEGEVTNVPDIHPLLNRDGYAAWPELLEHGLIPVARAAFTSILLPRRCLEIHGLPIRQMFIWGEDTEFTMRVTRDIPGFAVGASIVRHSRSIAGRARIETETDPVRIGYHRHMTRNEIYISRRYYSLARTLVRHWLVALKLFLTGRFTKASVVARGSIDGLFFRPKVEPADAPLTDLGVEVTPLTRTARHVRAKGG
jgi:GT2 family glycosyltransferase